jgi:hypothetical protein
MAVKMKIDLNDLRINEYAAKTEADCMTDGSVMTLAYRFQEGLMPQDGIDGAFQFLSHHSVTNPIASFIYAELLSSAGSEDTEDHEGAIGLYRNAIKLALPRLRDPSEPFNTAPLSEEKVREIIGMCLTNVGSILANGGSQYEAASFFRRSITMCPSVPNTHVCLGNMGFFHPDASKVPPKEAYESWKTACDLESKFPHLASQGSRFRQAVVANGETIERLYGRSESEKWVSRAVVKISKSPRWLCMPAFRTLADYPKSGHFSDAAASTDRFFEILRGSFGSTTPLEVKVTVAATILANLAIMGGNSTIDTEAIASAVKACELAEPLLPLIGDDEWEDLAPPTTNHLLERRTQSTLLRRINVVVDTFRREMNDVPVADALIGFLFKFDQGFRHGILTMVEMSYRKRSDLLIGELYVPGIYVGEPADEQLRQQSA